MDSIWKNENRNLIISIVGVVLCALVLVTCSRAKVKPLPLEHDGTPDSIIIINEAKAKGIDLRGVPIETDEDLKILWDASQGVK